MKKHSAVVETKFDDLVNHNLKVIERVTNELLVEMERQFTQMLYATISEACERSGNTVDAKAAGSLEEAFLATIEKIEFSSGRDEVAKAPELHMHPDMAKRMIAALEGAGPEFVARADALYSRKCAEAVDREKSRKSRFVRYKAAK